MLGGREERGKGGEGGPEKGGRVHPLLLALTLKSKILYKIPDAY